MTDIFQEMIDNGEKIKYTPIKEGWKEIDTVEDYKNALKSFKEKAP